MMKCKFISVFGVVFGLVASSLGSPSRESLAHVGYSNDLFWPSAYVINGNYDPLGNMVSANGSQSFTGLDRSGDEQTSIFGGQSMAVANYGLLKTSVSAGLVNSFYNGENAANGAPNIYFAAGQATFTDTLKFVGTFMLPTFKVRYTYFIHGNVTGDRGYGALSMEIGTNYESKYVDNAENDQIAQYHTTESYELNPNLEHTIRTNFLAGFQVDTNNLQDGTNISGTANFGSTVTMTGIEVFDQNNNPFYDYSILAESGTAYPKSAPVPEPATILSCGAGLAMLLKKRKGKNSR